MLFPKEYVIHTNISALCAEMVILILCLLSQLGDGGILHISCEMAPRCSEWDGTSKPNPAWAPKNVGLTLV